MEYDFLEATAEKGLTDDEIKAALAAALRRRPKLGKVLILPPDITRMNSYAGPITRMLCELLPEAEIDVMPALGTHAPVTEEEMDKMFPGVPHALFRRHDWKRDVERLGTVPASFVGQVSEGWMEEDIPVEVNRRLLDSSYDLIISVGQVVPHEVVGMANYNKNLFVGCGGRGMINASHFLGALYGMENMMGRDLTPVHKVFDYAEARFCRDLPLLYVLTVTAPNASGTNVRSLAVGRDREMFSASIRVSQKWNLNILDAPVRKCVAYLDPEEFHTTWVGNKSVYRTRMAIADGGELLVIAPGVSRFGEDPDNDVLIRKYGYVGRKKILEFVKSNRDLAENLSAAAHLIHGSSDDRFSITYAPGHLTRAEVEGVGFKYMPLEDALAKYDIAKLRKGWNVVDGEEIYFVPNPALGLWADGKRFREAGKGN